VTLHTNPEIQALIDRALAEDLAFSDPTTGGIIDTSIIGLGVVRSKALGILAGVDIALGAFQRVDPSLRTQALLSDGDVLEPGISIAQVEGCAASILQAERTALNFLQRTSGIATATQSYVQAVRDFNVRIIDTRKTPPGLRYLDKYAVRMGGGHNHRLNLADGILIKDNHLAALAHKGLDLKQAIDLALSQASHMVKVEVEVTSIEEARLAAEAGVHVIMLDNMNIAQMREAVQVIAGRAVVEASGGINLETVKEVASTGVDLISVGSLTHSVRALDIGMDLEFP
jgi:nicotinate-nucleotide pyrophosphorylase (carboxylating)